jgi:tetratricopeptide (TPR) repeat protein
VACWPLLVVFLFWANLDEWFLVGPLTVGLYWLGTLLQGGATARTRTLGVALVAGLVVGLVNPHHVRVYAAPVVLSPAAALEAYEVGGSAPTGSPLADLSPDALARLSPAGMAYFLLMLVSLAALVIGVRSQRWPHVLVLGAFLLLSFLHVAAVPFFAVVAGPLVALSLQEFVAWRAQLSSPGAPRPAAFWGRLATVLALAALVVTAWPGWLQGFPAEPRQWYVESDPSLEEAARQVAQWHQAGQLGEASQGFNFSPVVAHYFAWLCPEEKGFLDGRARVFAPDVLADFRAVRDALREPIQGEDDWRAILRRRHVTHLIIYDHSERSLSAVLTRLLADPQEWPLVYLRGRTTIFAWRDPAAPTRTVQPAVPVVDLRRRAYEPDEAEKAPETWPGRDPRPRGPVDAFDTPRPGTNIDRDEALVYLAAFAAQRPRYLRRAVRLWENSLAAAAVGAAAPGAPGLPPPNPLFLGLVKEQLDPQKQRPTGRGSTFIPRLTAQLRSDFLANRDDGPPGALLLAIRAARRALQAQPDDPVAHLLLGEAYLLLMRQTRERVADASFPRLDAVRKVQCITVLQQAVRLRPELIAAHANLVTVYLQAGAFDLALAHLQFYLAQSRAAGPPPGEGPRRKYAEDLANREDFEKRLGKQVRDKVSQVEIQSLDRNVLGRAQLAQFSGLPNKALDILKASDDATFGLPGALMELQLFLYTGSVKEVREWMEPAQEGVFGRSNYRWLRAQLAAADGSYAQADEDLRLMQSPGITIPELQVLNWPVRNVIALMLGKSILERHLHALTPVQETPAALMAHLAGLTDSMREQADLLALRGMLALEEGDTVRAAQLLRESLEMRPTGQDGGGLLARHYLQFLTQEKRPGR